MRAILLAGLLACVASVPLTGQSLEVGDEVVFAGGPSQPPQSRKTGSVVKFSNLRDSSGAVEMPSEPNDVSDSLAAVAPEAPVVLPPLVAYELAGAPLERLAGLLRSSGRPVDRFSALRALPAQPDRPAAASLALEGLGDEDLRVVAEAARALGSLGDARAVKPLEELLNQPDPLLLEAVVSALGSLGAFEAIRPLADGSGGRVDLAARAALARSAGSGGAGAR